MLGVNWAEDGGVLVRRNALALIFCLIAITKVILNDDDSKVHI
jgi:hypothetical protein